MNTHANQLVPIRRSKHSAARTDSPKALAAHLRGRLRGEVRFDGGSRSLYARDASNFRMVPIGVVVPKDDTDVVETLAACRQFGVPVLSRGGGTSLAGQCCNEAVVMDFSKYMGRVLEIDPSRRIARVQPGTVLDELRQQAGVHGLTFGPDPATHDRCTLGGMLGNDSCGVHAVMSEFYGPGPRMHDNVVSMEVLTYDGCRFTAGPTQEHELQHIIDGGGRRGQIYAALRALRDRYAPLIRERFPNIPRRVSGYNLPALLPENGFNVAKALVGSEGTCVTVLEATVSLIQSWPFECLLVLGYPDAAAAGDAVTAVRSLHDKPIGCEGLDRALVDDMKKKAMHTKYLGLLPEGDAWLLVQFGGMTQQEALEKARMARAILEPETLGSRLYDAADEREEIWEIRESGLGATAFVPGQADTWPGWEDSAVPPDQVGNYLRALRELLDEFGYQASLYGHFAQGCIHTRIPFDLVSEQGLEDYRRFTRRAAELVIRFGGSLSGEHGDGQQRGEMLSLMYGDEIMQAHHQFKSAFDPEGKMNPGKLVDALPRTSNLALGPGYQPADVKTHFAFAADSGSVAHATLRCVGVGECRRGPGKGVMCPSFMVLREEEHSTRGRAHLLHEMLRGEVITDGWQSEAVKQALDLCLSCKGCTHDCPVKVDIPTLKAEFLSHYYEKKGRPRSAYTLGWIQYWAKLGSLLPRLSNLVTRAPGSSALAKRIAGVHASREIPSFAPRTFRAWFARNARPARGRRRVMLWPDTFNNHFHPEVLIAAADVLDRAGCDVVLPPKPLCCGRPLYDYGMLERAKDGWRGVLDVLGEEIERGTPLVGVEPSCVAAFRDELVHLFPDDLGARQLSENVFTLAGFLESLHGYQPPEMPGAKALVHFHCHHKGTIGVGSDEALLRRIGLDVEQPQKTCCGMAGAFGFEREHYDLAMSIGELGLLPAVRQAPETTLIVADGFSCRTQVQQGSSRRALHTAEVLQLAHQREQKRLAPEAEQRYSTVEAAKQNPSKWARSAWTLGASCLLLLVIAAGVWWLQQPEGAQLTSHGPRLESTR